MDKKLQSQFQSPSSQYRGKPFWAWNGKLNPDELRRQIRMFRQMGLGGFFMHSRVGLATPYLGREWFECIDACVDEAAKLGMEAWLYDEDRWPSGAAGGLVTRNPAYRLHYLALQEHTDAKSFKWSPQTLGACIARVEGAAAYDIEPLPRGRKPATVPAGRTIVSFVDKELELEPWFNGYTYLDTMSHAAVKRFIQVTHEAYRKRIGGKFGNVVPGIFTDEPNYGDRWGATLPWTAKLPQIFRKRYGYDVLQHMVELFFDVEGRPVSQARWHFNDCVTFLFVDAFSRQIGDWCDANNMLATGHVLNEQSLIGQTQCVGAAMRHYEYMQAPGIDRLSERWRENITGKQLASAARQFGRKWRLSELYGVTGWDFTLEGHKAIGDWHVAMGVNLRCPHLSFYTMLAEAKRDYPASISYQSPWWDVYAQVEDYYARLHVMMSRGDEVRDLLVVHPIESMWVMRRKGWNDDKHSLEFDRAFEKLTDDLLYGQIDFDYGDEDILSRHGKVSKAAGGARLKVGKATYKAMLVPPMITMRSSTLQLVRKFKAAGGTVYFAGPAPEYVDALASQEARELAANGTAVPAAGEGLVQAVEAICRKVRITGADGKNISPALYLLREDKEAMYLFVANTSHVATGMFEDVLTRDRTLAFDDVRITVLQKGLQPPVELEAQTARTYQADARQTAEGWEIRTSLPRIASKLFVLPKGKAWTAKPRRWLRQVGAQALDQQQWPITLSEPNVLVLDKPKFRIGNGHWQEPQDILRVDSLVRDALGIEHRGGSMVQPWAQPKPTRSKSLPVNLVYSFHVARAPTGPLELAIEQPQLFKVAVNTTPISTETAGGYWVDRSLKRLAIDPAMLVVGHNEIALWTDYSQSHSGLETAYLLGNFGVELSDLAATLVGPVSQLRIGDWTKQHLPFYSGNVAYRGRIDCPLSPDQRLMVRLGQWRGSAVRVLVDGRSAGLIWHEPYELDITDTLTGPQCELVIEVLGHRRNSHGPLHNSQKWPAWTGPGSFVTTGQEWFDGYQLVPCGLLTPPQIVVMA